MVSRTRAGNIARQSSVQTVEDDSDVDMITRTTISRSSRSKSSPLRHRRDSSVIEVARPGQASSSKMQTRNAITIEEPSTRFILDGVELRKLSEEEKAQYHNERFLPPVPGQPDLPGEDYALKRSTATVPRKPRWKTIADTSEAEDEDEMPLPKRARNKANYHEPGNHADNVKDGDFDESIHTISSGEDEADLESESEGDEWNKRPPTRPQRSSRRRGVADPDAETIDVSTRVSLFGSCD